MRKENDKASALWRRFYAGEITIAEYERSYPKPVLLAPGEKRDSPAWRDRWVANETTVWEPEA